VGFRTYPQDTASILLAVIYQEASPGQGPPWLLGKLVCSGGDIFFIATSTGLLQR